MSERKIVPSDLVGKTIIAINNRSTNTVALKLSDGSILNIWAEVFNTIPSVCVYPKCNYEAGDENEVDFKVEDSEDDRKEKANKN